MGRKAFFAGIFLIAGALMLIVALLPSPTARAVSDRYPYGSADFTQYVSDSCRATGTLKPPDFYRFMDTAGIKSAAFTPLGRGRNWSELIARQRRALAATRDPKARAEKEIALAAALHRTVKKAIPKFSLDRGFEFTSVVRTGERQCLLQSVLIAGLLQAMGADAGIVMVSRNPEGESSNNGHVVTVLRLSDGSDVMVDASEPTPFVKHQRLFAPVSQGGGYQYVEPVFAPKSARITRIRLAEGGRALPVSRLGFLTNDYVRSQFDYYRGERAPGGILAKSPTPAGLSASARWLETSVRDCPRNPLATYMLGRVYTKQGRTAAARAKLQAALGIYRRAGWVPPGVGDAIARLGQ